MLFQKTIWNLVIKNLLKINSHTNFDPYILVYQFVELIFLFSMFQMVFSMFCILVASVDFARIRPRIIHNNKMGILRVSAFVYMCKRCHFFPVISLTFLVGITNLWLLLFVRLCDSFMHSREYYVQQTHNEFLLCTCTNKATENVNIFFKYWFLYTETIFGIKNWTLITILSIENGEWKNTNLIALKIISYRFETFV